MALTEVKSNKTFTDFYGRHLNNVMVFGNPDVSEVFESHVKMEFWGENYISLHEEGVKGTPTLKEEIIELDLFTRKLKWFKSSNDTLHWVEIFKEKPVGNKWSLKISDGGQFKYCYQTPLIEEAAKIPGSRIEYFTKDSVDYIKLVYPPGGAIIADWRPLDIDGSIAVYHKTKKHNRLGGKKYRTGKVLHIIRPKAIDANGKWVWCDIRIENGVYTRTIPQKFLDEAVYPVTINDEFGYHSVGASNSGQDADFQQSYWLGTIGGAGTCTQISIYCSSDETSMPISAALYDNDPNGYSDGNDDDKDPDNRLALSDELSLSPNASWMDFPVTNGGPFVAGDLWAAQNPDAAWVAKYDTDITFDQSSTWYYNAHSTDPDSDNEDPWGSSTGAANDRKYSTYIEYTPVAVGAPGIMTTNTGYWGPTI